MTSQPSLGQPFAPGQPWLHGSGAETMRNIPERTPKTETAEASRRRRRQPQSRQGGESKAPVLACPFFKSDPQKYHDCRTFVLRRIKDIKQHINRKHRLPEHHCSHCYHGFDSEQELDEHLRTRRDPPCESRDRPGITDRQKQLFRQYRSRGKEIQEQWYDIWDILFPGKAKPDGIYLSNPRDTRVQMLRDIWQARKREINDSANIDGPTEQVIDRVVDIFLKHVATDMGAEQTESSGTTLTTTGPKTPPPPPEEGREAAFSDEKNGTQELLCVNHDDDDDSNPYGGSTLFSSWLEGD
ncbi:hypothetical protein QBC47DRAFT_392476 [Echria macrotheca]|uniref:C2H2-type domain-containing protein n=1 Tax=Echria macrotheca TaxID=438768 RepID=A0AAJ0F7J3_9PEZI|nr:hypothetical protein QBC47DRAFT_392476 [Echria macrotheca]